MPKTRNSMPEMRVIFFTNNSLIIHHNVDQWLYRVKIVQLQLTSHEHIWVELSLPCEAVIICTIPLNSPILLIQWNLCIMVTLGTNKSGCYTEVTLLYSQDFYANSWMELNLGLEVTIDTGSTVWYIILMTMYN